MTSQESFHWQEVLTLGFVWAVVGAIYSAILVAMLAFLHGFDIGPVSIGLAASLAGAVGALFYGSVRLAVLAMVAALIASFGYIALVNMHQVSPQAVMLVSAVAGVIVGGSYGLMMLGSRVRQATGKTLAGLYAGFVAGMPLAALAAYVGDIPIALAAAVLTPLTGVIYVLVVDKVIVSLRDLPSPVFSGALVGGGVAGLIGICVWAFIGLLDSAFVGSSTEAVRFAWSELPRAAMGGMIGGFIAGAALAVVRMKWTRAQYLETHTHFPPRRL